PAVHPQQDARPPTRHRGGGPRQVAEPAGLRQPKQPGGGGRLHPIATRQHGATHPQRLNRNSLLLSSTHSRSASASRRSLPDFRAPTRPPRAAAGALREYVARNGASPCPAPSIHGASATAVRNGLRSGSVAAARNGPFSSASACRIDVCRSLAFSPGWANLAMKSARGSSTETDSTAARP